MGKPAAKENDKIQAKDIHIEMVQAGTAVVPTPTMHPFEGILDGNLSSNVLICGKPAATVDSTATNTPSHTPKAGPFQTPPKNKAKIILGSKKVFINGKEAGRHGDLAMACNDPSDLPVGKVNVGNSSVYIGG